MKKSANKNSPPPVKEKRTVHITTPGGLVNLIMPYLLVKIKEETMSLQENMDHLYLAACDISQGVNALEMMSQGLAHMEDPYAEGFSALYAYLFDADQKLRKYLDICIKAI